MASSSRSRGLQSSGTSGNEERDLWIRFKSELSDQVLKSKRVSEITAGIAAVESKLSKLSDPDMEDLLKLENLYKEQLRLCHEEQAALRRLIHLNDLLIALRSNIEKDKAKDNNKVTGRHHSSRY